MKCHHVAKSLQIDKEMMEIQQRIHLVQREAHEIFAKILINQQSGIPEIAKLRKHGKWLVTRGFTGFWKVFEKENGFVAPQEPGFGGDDLAIEAFRIEFEQFGRGKTRMASERFAEHANICFCRSRTEVNLRIAAFPMNPDDVISGRAYKRLLEFDVPKIPRVLREEVEKTGFPFDAENRMFAEHTHHGDGVTHVRPHIDHSEFGIFLTDVEGNAAKIESVFREPFFVERQFVRERKAQPARAKREGNDWIGKSKPQLPDCAKRQIRALADRPTGGRVEQNVQQPLIENVWSRRLFLHC